MNSDGFFLQHGYVKSVSSSGAVTLSDASPEVVDEILKASSDSDFIVFAEKHKLLEFSGLSDVLSSKHGDEDLRKAYAELEKRTVASMRLLRDSMELAISLYELHSRDTLKETDLEECGIEVRSLTDDETDKVLFIQKNNAILHAAKIDATDFVRKEDFLGADVSKLVVATCTLNADAECDYLALLSKGKSLAKSDMFGDDGAPLEASTLAIRTPTPFPRSSEYLHKCTASLLRGLFEINLSRSQLSIDDSCNLCVRSDDVYSSIWYYFACDLSRGRAFKCQACGKPVLALNERGNPRRFCSTACSKWAQRHPGERRGRKRR